jgi:hypothetical protein
MGIQLPQKKRMNTQDTHSLWPWTKITDQNITRVLGKDSLSLPVRAARKAIS